MRAIRSTTPRPTRTLVGIVALALLAIPSSSVAAPQPPRPLQDSAVGSGSSLNCGGVFTSNVRSGPNGENPTGEITCGSLFGGPVSCLNVNGNVALALVPSTSFGPIGVRITDNGATGDRLEAFPLSFTSGAGCPTPLAAYGVFDFTGDIVVVDAPPSPTSKEQCKNGGFAQFGFKNQGQCVAFVQRGPKP